MIRWVLLVRAFPRVAPWRPMAPAAVLALALLVWFDLRGGSDAVWPLRGAAVLLALGAAYVLDDPASAVTDPVPTTRAARRTARLLVVVTLVGVMWSALLGYADLAVGTVPVGALSVELAALLAAVLAGAAIISGAVAAPAVVGLLLASTRLPPRWSLLAGVPGDAEWAAAHRRWAAMLLAAMVCLAVASRDRAARPLLRRT